MKKFLILIISFLSVKGMENLTLHEIAKSTSAELEPKIGYNPFLVDLVVDFKIGSNPEVLFEMEKDQNGRYPLYYAVTNNKISDDDRRLLVKALTKRLNLTGQSFVETWQQLINEQSYNIVRRLFSEQNLALSDVEKEANETEMEKKGLETMIGDLDNYINNLEDKYQALMLVSHLLTYAKIRGFEESANKIEKILFELGDSFEK